MASPESTQGRKAARKAGLALPPATPGAAPGFPVTDPEHWDKARQAVGRIQDPKRRAALAALLRKTAPRFGRTQELKKSWAAGSSHGNNYARTVDMSQDALASVLTLRGAPDPQALAAWIGRRRGTGRSRSLANPDADLYLSVTTKDEQGMTLTCPECGHVAPAGDFGASGASLQTKPGDLQTPQPSTAYVRSGAATTVRGGSASHALAGDTRNAISLAAGTLTARRHAIQGPADVLVARAQDGTAVLRHRHGGATIATLSKTDAGKWVATVNGTDLAPRDHQRTALMEAVGTYNKAVTGALHRAEAPLQPPPQQTELMAEYGIPAIRALATPTTGASDGPRMTTAGGDDSTDADGLTPKGQAIKKKLIAKGFPEARAVAFAKMSQKTKKGQFGKQAVAS